MHILLNGPTFFNDQRHEASRSKILQQSPGDSVVRTSKAVIRELVVRWKNVTDINLLKQMILTVSVDLVERNYNEGNV